jgi:hypothetical protein
MFHIPSLKAAMKDAGYAVTPGDSMNAKDTAAYLDFAYHKFGLSNFQASYGLSYPVTVTSKLPGHPDNPMTPKVEAKQPEALIPPVVFPPPTPKPHPINIDDLAKPGAGVPGEIVETPDEVAEDEHEEAAE